MKLMFKKMMFYYYATITVNKNIIKTRYKNLKKNFIIPCRFHSFKNSNLVKIIVDVNYQDMLVAGNAYICDHNLLNIVDEFAYNYYKNQGKSHLEKSHLENRIWKNLIWKISFGKISFGKRLIWKMSHLENVSFGKSLIWKTSHLEKK